MSQHDRNNISFENTEYAFAYKSDSELKKANFLFTSMGMSWLVKFGLTAIPLAIKFRFPFIKSIIRNTLFSQFVGGETLEQTASVAEKLSRYGVDVILDYGVEGGEGEENFELATETFINVTNYAASQKNIPFISIKITGICRFALLEKIDDLMHLCEESTLIKKYTAAIEQLEKAEKDEWQNLVNRMQKICYNADKKNIAILVDAEESWIQDPVDAITLLMMDNFNRNKAVVYNTIQLYRHDRFNFLKHSHQASQNRGFIMGVKLVRGAYMEKERLRAAKFGYDSPIQKDKETTDKDFNAAVKYSIEHIADISLIVASHNEESNTLAVSLLNQNSIQPSDKRIHFSQLYGMSDNITFNLAKSGYSVSKYLPFGPIKDVIPYLMRRAQENSSVAGQTGRELGLIKRELGRRLNS